MSQYEALLLVDDDLGDGVWYLHPDVRAVVGWWPDGAPAVEPDPDDSSGRQILLGLIPKRPAAPDGTSLQHHPSVTWLANLANALNDGFYPYRGSVLADAMASGVPEAGIRAFEAHLRLRLQLGADQVEQALNLARDIVQARVRENSDG